MPMPSSQDYNEAIQSPSTSFSDAELGQGEVVTNAMGLPQPRSGNFADVYEFKTGPRKWAIKCFTREIPGLRERYREISAYLKQVNQPFMVDFTYLEQGIRVRAQWFPILKMHWVEGLTLNDYVKSILDKPQRLDLLGQIWVKLAVRLREASIAHCDLQHGNVLLVPGRAANSLAVKLVDYDGTCVPALTMLKSIELGHPNFQHPQRARQGIYSLEVDRFSHLVIYTALRALMHGGKELWQRYDNGDNLLFKQADFEAPARSPLLQQMANSSDAQVRMLACVMSDSLARPLEQTPHLEQLATKVTATPPMDLLERVRTPEELFAGATAGRGSQRRPKRGNGLWLGGAAAAVASVIAIGAAAAFMMRGESNKKTEPEVQVTQPKPPCKKEKGKTEPKKEPPSQANLPTKPEAPEKTPAKQITNSLGMKLAVIPAGKFTMGSSQQEIDRCLKLGVEFDWLKECFLSESPEHEVKITQSFYMGSTEVTVGQFRQFIKANPNYNVGDARWEKPGFEQFDDSPVVWVSWQNAVDYCNWLSEKEGKKYRLPSEAEWEYSCRAGKAGSRYSFGNEETELGLHAWSAANSGGKTHPVGKLKANDWGLFDMHGNAWEWCQDYYDPNYYKSSPKQNPPGPGTGGKRVYRGGSCYDLPQHCRSAFRHREVFPFARDPRLGFRVACEIPRKMTEQEEKQWRIAGEWQSGDGRKYQLNPDGTVDTGPGRWFGHDRQFLFFWPNNYAPGGAWLDFGTLGPDDRSFEGRNQFGGKITFKKLKDQVRDNRPLASTHPPDLVGSWELFVMNEKNPMVFTAEGTTNQPQAIWFAHGTTLLWVQAPDRLKGGFLANILELAPDRKSASGRNLDNLAVRQVKTVGALPPKIKK